MRYLFAVGMFVSYVLVSCSGLYLMKAANGWKTIGFAGGFALYGLGAVMWLVILRLFPLSIAFPIAAGALIVCTMATGRVFLQETVSPLQLFAAGLIILGIALTAVAGNK